MGAILSVEKFSMTMADGVTSVTANLVASDITALTPRVSYRNTSGVEQGWNDMTVDVEFLTGPNRVQLTRNAGDGEIQAKVVVTEWDTAGDIAIQTGSFSMTGASLAVTITALTDLTKSFATFGYETTQGTDIDANFVRAMLTTTTNLQLTRISSTGTIDGHWWVVEDGGSNFDVQRVQALSMTSTSADATITSIDTAKTLVMCSQAGTSGGENPDDVAMGFLFDDTTFRTTRDANAGTVTVDAFIITWSVADVAVQRGTITMGSGVSTATQANTAVNLSNSFVHCPMVPNGCSSSDLSQRQSAYASIEQNSNVQVESNGNDDSSTEFVPWELLEFDIAVSDQSAIIFGTNF